MNSRVVILLVTILIAVVACNAQEEGVTQITPNTGTVQANSNGDSMLPADQATEVVANLNGDIASGTLPAGQATEVVANLNGDSTALAQSQSSCASPSQIDELLGRNDNVFREPIGGNQITQAILARSLHAIALMQRCFYNP